MSDIKIFNNEEFGQVRTIIIDNELWFVGKDVAQALGYMETNAMAKKLDTEDFIYDKLEGMNMKSILLNESGLYSAIFGSKLPTAKKFKHWVTAEVLPSIRKTGTYTMNPNPLNPSIAEGVANLARVTERIMKAQGSYPYKIAEVFKTECEQFGIHLPDDFVRIPEVQQLTLFS